VDKRRRLSMKSNSVKALCFRVALVLVLAGSAAGQSVKKVVAVPAEPGLGGGGKPPGILVFFDSYRTLPPVLTQPTRYTLFRFNPKRMDEGNVNLSNHIWALPSVECHPIGGYCEIRSAALAVELDAAKSYILGIDGIRPEREVFTFAVTEKAAIKGAALPTDARNSIQVTAPVAIRVSGTPNYVILKRDVLKIAPGSTYLIPDTEDIPVVGATQSGVGQNTVTLTLGEKLSEGRAHSLRVTSGLQTALTGTPRPIKAAGTVDIASVSSNTDAPRISATLSSNAAVHQKAFFDLKVDLKIKNRPLYFENTNTPPVIWNPTLAMDIGFRSTKSANSIVFSVMRQQNLWICFKRVVLTATEKAEQEQVPGEPPCGAREIVVPDPPSNIEGAVVTNAYAGWAKTPWYKRSHVGFQIGPKLEADRDFEKVNILGSARFDFVFHRWIGSINNKRRLIMLAPDLTVDKKAAAGKLLGPFFGFTLVPYISFDAGKRAYSNTVDKEITVQVNGEPTTVKTSVEVPEFNIARATAGFVSTFEWFTGRVPTTLTFDESLTFIGSREFAAFTNDEGAFLRIVRGFHPLFKTSLDFAIDPGRRYNFNITWENGRTPPNFEYLNKVTSGLKVIY
jgi:hypothetical protein